MGTEFDLFLSYAHQDAGRVLPIWEALRSAGLKVWLDEDRIAHFESISESIQTALTRSRALLAYFSKAYASRRACQWELTTAFLAAQMQGDPRIRVLVINPETSAGHIQPVELRDAKFCKAPAPGDTKAIAELVNTIRHRAVGIQGTIGQIQPPEETPWYGMRGVGSTKFVGRLETLWHVHSLLNAHQVPVITDACGPGIVQVRGLGGIGKSLLAEEYARRFGAAYPGGIFWLRAHDNQEADRATANERSEVERECQLRRLATSLKLSVDGTPLGAVEDALRSEIERRGVPCLWVVDDVPSNLDGQLLRRWFAPHPLARTLITTRSRDYGSLAKAIDLDVLEQNDAYQLLTGRRQPSGQAEERAAHSIVRQLGRHPLAADVAGAALAGYAGLKSFVQFSADLAKENHDALEVAAELAETLPNGHEKSIATTLLYSIRSLNEPGRDILRLASTLAAAPFSTELVISVFAEVDKLDRESAQERATRGLRDAWSLSLLESDSVEELRFVHPVVARTTRFSKTCQRSGKHTSGFLSKMLQALHVRTPIVDRTARLREAVVKVLAAELPKVQDPQAHSSLDLEVIHARALTSGECGLAEAHLLGWIAVYDSVHSAFGSAGVLFEKQYETLQRLGGPQDLGTIMAVVNLAAAVGQGGDPKSATKILRNLVPAFSESGDPQVLKAVLPTINNLAEFHRMQGDLAEAQSLFEWAIKTSRPWAAQLPETQILMGNLASTFKAQGRMEDARRIQEEVLQTHLRVLGPDHPHTLTSMNNLAETMAAMGDLAGGRRLFEDVLAVRRRLLGREHPKTSVTAWNLAYILMKLNDRAAMASVFTEYLSWLLGRDPATLGAEQRSVLDQIRQVAGVAAEYAPDNVDSSGAILQMAEFECSEGRYEQAEQLYLRALDLRAKIHGPEHRSTANTINTLAELYRSQGRYHDAEELHRRALTIREKTLGRDHIETANSLNNLGLVYFAQGRLREAEPLLQEALATATKTFGQDHHDTVSTINNLALVCYRAGRYAQAEALYQRVLATLGTGRGQRHPDAAQFLRNYAALLRDTGRETEACVMEKRSEETWNLQDDSSREPFEPQ